MLAARADGQVENDKVISSRRPEGNLKRPGNHREFFDEAFVFTKLSSNSNNLFFHSVPSTIGPTPPSPRNFRWHGMVR
jgi:hypothetical protein